MVGCPELHPCPTFGGNTRVTISLYDVITMLESDWMMQLNWFTLLKSFGNMGCSGLTFFLHTV